MYIEKGELFTTKMLDLYGKYEDILTQIIQNRDQYFLTRDPLYEPYVRIIETYDLSQKINGSDPDVSSALHATCLWYIYKEISGDDEDPNQFLDEQEPDAKGKQKPPKLNLNKLARYLERKYLITTYKGMIFLYIDNQFYNNADRLKKDIVKILENIGYSNHSKIKDLTNDIIYRVTCANAKFRELPFNKKSAFLIPCANGVIVLRNINTLLPTSPVWGFTYSIPANYDPSTDTEQVKKFLESLVDTSEEYELLLQIPAQALMQNPEVQISYLFTGNGANGKSTELNLITALLGEQNVTAVSLQELAENRFAAACLSGKLMNAFPDLPKTTIKTTGKYKALTGSDGIMVENKYGPPFKMRNKAALVFSANALPEVDDSSYAFWRRWCIIEFNHTFKMDPEFTKKLITSKNISAYLNLVIDKLNRIQKFGFTQSTKVEQNMENWQRRSNSAYAFVIDMLEKSSTGYIRQDSLYNLYISYCDDHDFVAFPKPRFTREVEKYGAIIGQTTEAQSRVRVFRGIKIKTTTFPEIKSQESEAPMIF